MNDTSPLFFSPDTNTNANILTTTKIIIVIKTEHTYRVLRPVRPLNIRPWSPVSLFPVSSSSKTPPAPSNTPSRMSFNLLLLRLLQEGEKIHRFHCFLLVFARITTREGKRNVADLITVISPAASEDICSPFSLVLILYIRYHNNKYK